MLTPHEADVLFVALSSEYSERKAEAEARVRRWQWATNSFYDPRPLFFECNRNHPGRLLRKPPVKTVGRVQCGLDVNDRVVVEREYNRFGFYESFYAWERQPIQVARYDYCADKNPINIILLGQENQRIVVADQIAQLGWSHEEFCWNGPWLFEIRVSYAPREAGHYLQLKPWHVVRPIYSSDELARVELHWPADPPARLEPIIEVVFERTDLVSKQLQ